MVSQENMHPDAIETPAIKGPTLMAPLRRIACVMGCLLAGLFTPGAKAVEITGVNVSVDFGGMSNRAALTAWIERSAGIVRGYYGEFPSRQLAIHLRQADGHGVKTGTTYGMSGGMIRVVVGREVTEEELRDDWVLVHEMIHLALPDIGRDHAWLSEGLSVYVEGIARAQAGNRTEEDVWSEQVRSMPKGLPLAGDEGLDHTHTWGRTYWGGALFCLMADVGIRRATQNRSGLQDAMRAVARASGGLSSDWPIGRVLSTADAAVGGSVLGSLYAQWKDRPVTPDLPALWRRLGIDPQGSAVHLRDDAPLSAIRRAIMRGGH